MPHVSRYGPAPLKVPSRNRKHEFVFGLQIVDCQRLRICLYFRNLPLFLCRWLRSGCLLGGRFGTPISRLAGFGSCLCSASLPPCCPEHAKGAAQFRGASHWALWFAVGLPWDLSLIAFDLLRSWALKSFIAPRAKPKHGSQYRIPPIAANNPRALDNSAVNLVPPCLTRYNSGAAESEEDK